MDVMTVRGPVRGDQLGLTLPHEHLFVDLFRVTRVRDGLLNDERLSTEEAARFKAAGGGTLVEVTNHGLRRNAAAMRRVAEATGLHVVMGTGWYREPYYDHDYIGRRTTRELAADFVAEIEQGEAATGIRPGIIGEIGADWSWVSPAEERVHRASGRAHRQTGLAVTLHALESPVGLQQLDLLREEGADLRRVIVGHCDTWPDPDYHEAIARQGAYVQFDTIRGIHPYETDKQLRLALEMVRRGHLERLLLSHDNCFRSHLVGYGGHGYAYIPTGFAPLLRKAGLSEEQLHVILVENPRRVLTGER
jgi:predicted metal-dependent phosphotriesterase family hydrolase